MNWPAVPLRAARLACALAVCWVLFCLVSLRESPASLVVSLAAWAAAPWGEALGLALFQALLRHGEVLGLALLAALAFSGLGEPVERFIHTGAPRGERLALWILLGFVLLGTAGMAFALCGLAFGPLFILVAAGACLLPGAGSLAGAVVRSRISTAGIGRAWIAIGFLPLVPVGLGMLSPDIHVDTWTYHLAIPDQVLRVHRLTAEGASQAHGSPLAAEFVYSLAVACGLDVLPHWLQAIPLAASVVLLSGGARRATGSGVAAWLAGGAVLTFAGLDRQLVVAKSDVAAAAFAVSGAICVANALDGRSRWLVASAALFGCGSAVKINAQVLAFLALAGLVPFARFRRHLPGWIAVAAAPAVPWLARSWIMFGNPLWPAFPACWPGSLWDPEDAGSIAVARGSAGAASSLAAAGPEFFRSLLADQPAVLLAVPFLLVASRPSGRGARWVTGHAMAACAVLPLLMYPEWPRLALPAFLALAGVAAVAAASAARFRPRWIRRTALAAAVLSPWLASGGVVPGWVPPVHTLAYLGGLVSPERLRARRLTTLDEAGRALERLGGGGTVLPIGEIRVYRMPARVLLVRTYGRTWAWELARGSATAGRIRVRFRQLDCRRVLHNFVTEGFPHAVARPYGWDSRMIAVWREFVERDLELAVPPARVDNENGGFCIWRLRRHSADRRPSFLPYLPGLESVYYSVTSQRDPDWALALAIEVDRRLPNVDWVRNQVARAYYMRRDWRGVLEYVRPGIAHGTMDGPNLWHAAVAALYLGRLDEAESYGLRFADVKPEARPLVDELLREVHALRTRR